MRAVARLDHELQQRPLGRQIRKGPLVRDLDDVGAGIREQRRDGRQLAGAVDDVDRNLGQPSLAGEFAGQHRGDQPGVDVAAGQDEADIAARKTIRRRQHRGKAGGARAFDDGLLDRDQHRQRALDLVFSDEDDVIDEMADDLGGDPARRFDGDAFGERVAAHRRDARP